MATTDPIGGGGQYARKIGDSYAAWYIYIKSATG